MDGVTHGAEAVRAILGAIRSLYEYQTITFVGSYRDTGILEDYTAQVRGEPIHCVALITRNAAGQPQHIVANYRPRSSLLLLSRLVREKLADTPMPSTSPPANPETAARQLCTRGAKSKQGPRHAATFRPPRDRQNLASFRRGSERLAAVSTARGCPQPL
jgi:hypothetical protein